MLFAGFALFLNGISYLVPLNRKMLGLVNLFCAFFMLVNTAIGLGFAPGDIGNYANAAAGFAFALNFLILGVHHLTEATDFTLFGWFSFVMCLSSLAFMTQVIVTRGPWILIYLWAMWAALWGQAFIASGLKSKAVDKLSPYFVIGNSVLSLLAPAFLILFGILL